MARFSTTRVLNHRAVFKNNCLTISKYRNLSKLEILSSREILLMNLNNLLALYRMKMMCKRDDSKAAIV